MSVDRSNGVSHANDAAAGTSGANHATDSNGSQVQFRIKNPFQPDTKFTVTLDKASSIHQVKEHLSCHYPSHPSLSSQKLIFQGRLLHNDETLLELFTSNIDADQRVMYLSIREGISVNRADIGSDGISSNSNHSNSSGSSSDANGMNNDKTKETSSASAPPTANVAAQQPATTSVLPSHPSSAYPHAFSHPLLPYLPQHHYSPYGGYYPYSYAQPFSHVPQVNTDASATSSDSFGLRNRFSSSASSSQPTAASESTDAHANALMAYHQALQQYHAMYTAAYQQHAAAYQQAYHQYSPYAATAAAAALHPFNAAQLLSQRGMSPASTVGGLSATSIGASSSTSSTTTAAPAGSILAALTARSAPIPPAATTSPTTGEAQAEEARAAAIREAVQAFVQHAQQANAIPAAAGPAGAVPAAAAGANGAAAVVPPAAGARNFWRYFDFRLMLKFAVLIVLFSQDGDSQRFILLFIAGFIAYLYQVGAFRRGGPPVRDEAQARAVARGDMEEEEEDEEVQAAMRAFQQQERDAQRQREAAGGAAPAVGVAANAPAGAVAGAAAPVVPAAPQGFLISVEKFIVGFFASLVPSWQPQTVPAALPPAPAAAAAVAPAAIPLEPVAQAPVEQQEGAVEGAGEAPAAAPLVPEPAPAVEQIPPLE